MSAARHNWRKPYRSMDASGGPDTAVAVGWAWIEEIAREPSHYHPTELRIESPTLPGEGRVIALYRRQSPIAVATIFRDAMNFAVLVRWKAPTSLDYEMERVERGLAVIRDIDPRDVVIGLDLAARSDIQAMALHVKGRALHLAIRDVGEHDFQSLKAAVADAVDRHRLQPAIPHHPLCRVWQQEPCDYDCARDGDGGANA